MTPVWFRAYNTQTTAVIMIFGTVVETISVSCNGQPFTADATAANHLITKVEVTGLTAGTEYPFTMTVNSVVYSDSDMNVGTMKASGAIKVAHFSCINSAKVLSSFYSMVDEYDIDYAVAIGDFPYPSKPGQVGSNNAWGGYVTVESDLNITNLQDVDTYLNHYKSLFSNAGVRYLTHRVPILLMPDDHDWGMDNYCGQDRQIACVNSIGGGTDPGQICNTDELDTHYDNVTSVMDAVLQGNPPNTDAGIDADAYYWRLNINDDIELICPDFIKYREEYITTPETNTIVGATQKTWLIGDGTDGVIHTSSASHKVIMSTKSWQTDGGFDNIDGLQVYTGERDELIAAIQNGLGISIASGDRHYFVVFEGASPDFFELRACPIGEIPFHDAYTAYDGLATWRKQMHGYGIIEVDGANDLVFKACDASGKVHWSGLRDKDTNVVSYPAQGLSF